MADRYLRQTTTGHVYVWAEHYAEREDMEEVFRDQSGEFVRLRDAVEPEAPVAAIPEAKKRGPRKKDAPTTDDVPPLFDSE